jgi:oligopeptide/dipeptide ABC transporter ATP-binding protein
MGQALLEIRNLKKHFPFQKGIFSRAGGTVFALDGVELAIKEGETLGLVGESGCGKSTLGKIILRLMEPTEGQVFFEGKELFKLGKEELRRLRPQMQMTFQDPYSSLNPRMRVGDIVGEGIAIQDGGDKKQKREMVAHLLEKVGVPAQMMDRYPHEFSGGQRQRIGIARALIMDPKLVVADEPVSALDVSIQAQVLNLLMDLREEYHLTCLFIAHDLRVVEYISDRVAIMYLGRIVELAESHEIYLNPLHPYTEALISAIPLLAAPSLRGRILLEGDPPPSPVDRQAGCKFFSRCRRQLHRCTQEDPALHEVSPGHFVACHLYDRQIQESGTQQ